MSAVFDGSAVSFLVRVKEVNQVKLVVKEGESLEGYNSTFLSHTIVYLIQMDVLFVHKEEYVHHRLL